MSIPDFQGMYNRSREVGNPIDATRKFLRLFVIDNEPSDIENEVRDFAEKDSEKAIKYATAIENLINDAHLGVGILVDLVKNDGGKSLDEPEGEEARIYLQKLIELVKKYATI